MREREREGEREWANESLVERRGESGGTRREVREERGRVTERVGSKPSAAVNSI